MLRSSKIQGPEGDLKAKRVNEEVQEKWVVFSIATL